MSNAQVNLNIDELKGFLTHIINNNRFLQKGAKPSVAVEIVGESGIGKTSSALQLANELSLNFVKLNLAQIEELGDLVGFPIRQFQLCPPDQVKSLAQPEKKIETKVEMIPTKRQVMVGDQLVTKTVMVPAPKVEVKPEEKGPACEIAPAFENCIWVDEHAIEEYTKQGYGFTGQKRMSYCPPEWIADKQGGGILILDDWNRADIRFIQAVMELVDRQEYISWKMPQDWHIILTANPDNGEYLVNTIDTAQRTRFVSVNLKHDVDVWARWAEKQGIDGRCINFLLMHPELINARTNPRSITTFFNCISSIPDFAAVEALALIQMVGEGSVGPEFSTLFTTFIHNKLDKLVSPKDILLHDNEAYILGELKSCTGTGNNYRADIASILTTRLINFTVTYSESHTISQKTIDRLIKLATDAEAFTDDLKYVLIKKVLNGNKQKFQKLMADPKVMTMAMK